MLVIILVFAVYSVLQKLVDYPIIRKIRKAKTAEEAIMQRKRLKAIRATFFIIFLIGFIGYSLFGFVINFDRWETKPLLMIRNSFVWFFLVIVYLFQWRKYDEFMGNISIFGKNDYLNKYKRFALFLRGFGDDVYSRKKKINKSSSFSGFSEYWFMYILQKRIHACAIGMTKESDSPYGAQRIYVNDESWKEDVSELMRKAEKIYVLMNDRPSCIWEIEQTKTFRNKTVYVVDDIEKYNNVKSLIGSEIGLPDIPLEILNNDNHFYIFYNDYEFVVRPYKNSVDGYCKLLGFDAKEMHSKIGLMKLRQTGWIIALFVLPMIMIMSLLFLALYLIGENPLTFLAFLLLCAITLYVLFKRFRNIRKRAKQQ